MARPIQGKQTKKLISIRLEPWIIEAIEKKFDTKSIGINEILINWTRKNSIKGKK